MIARMTVAEFLLYQEVTLCQLYCLFVDRSLCTLASNLVITIPNIYINSTVVLDPTTPHIPSVMHINYLNHHTTSPYNVGD